jgi:hypothetical protein
MVQTIGAVPGIPVHGTIRSVNPQTGIALFSLPLSQSNAVYPVKIPAAWVGPRGQISAGFPERGTNIYVVLGQGNEWVFLSYDQTDLKSTYDNDGQRAVSYSNKLKPGRWVTLVENDVGHIIDPKEGIIQGDSYQFSQADPIKGIYSSRFLQEMHFTDAHRNITGPVLRDLNPNSSRDISDSSLSGHNYNSALKSIGLDPRTETSVSSTSTVRNPAITESRSLYYEFVSSFGYTDDMNEARIYSGEDPNETKPYQRKKSRTDTLGLSLDQPNYLVESIIGTVIDIYGNILDINRAPLPNGIIDSLSFRKSENDNEKVFTDLREQFRKSIAYHFELNARKAGLENSLIDYSVNSDYARQRSRFSFDVDKEGQFKLNVPCSSETGNIPLPVRYENFSNLKGAEKDEDRGQFLKNITNNTDIQLETFGKGFVSLKSNESSLQSFSAPIDRNSGETISLGTIYHNLSDILFLHKVSEPYKTNGGYENSVLNYIEPVTEIASTEIIVAGDGANAGGRSGTISLDGSLSLSIGANTIDRQSLWVDTAGGIVAAIGRDKYDRSISASLDGDIYVEIGGSTINDDSRFLKLDNESMRDGVLDIRILNSGSMHTIRIDKEGIKIHTPQRIDIVSEGEMRFKSVNSNMYFDAENIYMYSSNNARLVLRASEGAPRTI